MDVLGVSLCLYDATGRARAYLNVLDTDGSSSSPMTGLTINGESGKASIALATISDLPTLVLHDEHGQRRLSTTGGRDLTLSDESGAVVWKAP
jgi:hypothetical protein